MSQNFLRIYKRTFGVQHVREIPRPKTVSIQGQNKD